MMIKFRCCDCNKEIGAPEEFAGKKVKCPQCDMINTVPEVKVETPIWENTDINNIGDLEEYTEKLPPIRETQLRCEESQQVVINKAIIIIPCVVIAIIACSVIVWYSARDTWEQDHLQQIIELADDGDFYFKKNEYKNAFEQYWEVLELIRFGNSFKNEKLKSTIDHTKEQIKIIEDINFEDRKIKEWERDKNISTLLAIGDFKRVKSEYEIIIAYIDHNITPNMKRFPNLKKEMERQVYMLDMIINDEHYDYRDKPRNEVEQRYDKILTYLKSIKNRSIELVDIINTVSKKYQMAVAYYDKQEESAQLAKIKKEKERVEEERRERERLLAEQRKFANERQREKELRKQQEIADMINNAKHVVCPDCSGTGRISGQRLRSWISAHTNSPSPSGFKELEIPTCSTCKGKGELLVIDGELYSY